MLDVAIIGAGVVGCSIARELSKYELDIAVIEKASDVCEGTSKANSGIAHAGYDAKPGTLKAKLNVRGSEIMEDLSKDLGFLYRRCGSFVLCFDENDREKLNELKARGDANGVKDIRILSASEAKDMESSLNDSAVAVLYAPTGAIVDPFGLTVCMANNAAVNGVNFIFNSEVIAITKADAGYSLEYRDLSNNSKTLEAKYIINAAGVYADRIHNMISDNKIEIIPRRGEYMLLDNTAGSFVGRTVFQLPTKLGKGVLITPTVHGNLLLGPTADDIEDKEDTDTTSEGMSVVKQKTSLSASTIPYREVITSFSGLRAKLIKAVSVKNLEKEQKENDFLIGELPDAKGFIDVAGIESPGLTSAPAIGEYVVALLKSLASEDGISLNLKRDIKVWRAPKPFAMSSNEERQAMVKENPLHGNIVCRCCTVTEGEIVNAIHEPVGATTSDGVKRRAGAGMGRCQSGFCNPKVVEILSRELGIDTKNVCKNDSGSNYLI